MSELQINAKDLLDGKLFQLSFSENIFPDFEINFKASDSKVDEELIEGFFSNPDVKEIFISKNLLKVRLNDDGDWKQVAKFMANLIRANRESLLSDNFLTQYNSLKELTENEMVFKIAEVVDSQISPSLSSHGGSVKVKGYRAGTLYLEFSGGCQGCSQVSATLKDGIEKILIEKFPEIQDIVDATDHNDGDNPFYK